MGLQQRRCGPSWILVAILKFYLRRFYSLYMPNITCLSQSERYDPNKICKIYNASLEKGVFPMKWKSGIVIPLPKIPNVKEAADLRPISLLPLPGKVLERLVCRRLHDFLNINNTLTQVQHGFRKGRL